MVGILCAKQECRYFSSITKENDMKQQRGFTLIELMIVVAIIGILAAIALPAYQDYTVKSKIGNAVASLAGEKIKVAANWNEGKTGDDLCEGLPAGTCTSGVLEGKNQGDEAVTVALTPTFPPEGTSGRITWACTIKTATGYEAGDSCPGTESSSGDTTTPDD